MSDRLPPNSFVYEPLPDPAACIRLLSLEPGSWDAPIRSKLHVVSLDTYPAYHALSYVWGDATDRRSIELCGYDHQITVNLEIALRYLRLEEQPRILWVDALCINQADLEERSNQVLLMKSIYQRATTVISWLGEAGDDSDEAINLIRELGILAIENDDDMESLWKLLKDLVFHCKHRTGQPYGSSSGETTGLACGSSKNWQSEEYSTTPQA